MPSAEDKIEDIHAAVRIADERQFWLFRGHARDDYRQKLVPKIFREDIVKRFQRLKSNAGYEAELASSFKNAAPSVYSRCPATDQHLGWLTLMQHYGAPTRLLDWSQSILVALFFCVEKDVRVKCSQESDECGGKGDEGDDKSVFVDGEVWAMDAVRLTDLVRSKSVKDHENECAAGKEEGRDCERDGGDEPIKGKVWSLTEAAEKLAQQAMADKRFWSRDKCRDEDCCKYPLPFGPELVFPRITSQLSWFTIHPRPEHGQSIDQLPAVKDLLVRYIVPAASKKCLREALAALGITRRTLFPDLDGLAESLVCETEREMRARDRSSAGGHDSAL